MLPIGLSGMSRVVKRTSPRWGEPVKGWADWAMTPDDSSKPTRRAISCAMAIWPCALHSPRRQFHRRPLGRGRDQRCEARAEVGEDRLQVGGARSRLELVEQRVVGLVADRDRLGLAALQRHHPPEGPGVGGEVVGGAGVGPGAHAARAGLADLAHEGLRNPQRPVALACREPQHPAGVVVEVVAGGQLRERVSDVGAHHLAVAQRRERAHLAGPSLGAARGHQGLTVPAQQPRRAGEVGERPHPAGDEIPVS